MVGQTTLTVFTIQALTSPSPVEAFGYPLDQSHDRLFKERVL